MIQIKKGIPVPAGKAIGGRPGRYPFNDMEVGDCFDVPIEADDKPDSVVRRIRVAATSWKKRSKAECGFAVRVLEEDGNKLVRIWKTPARPAKSGDMFA